MRETSTPSATYDRSWTWLIINLLIPAIGVLFFHWNLFGLLYIFWAELIFMGIFGLLRMLLSGGDHFMVRLGISAFFIVLYVALLMIVISFSLSSLDFDALFDFEGSVQISNLGLNFSIIALFVSFSVEFLKDFMFSGKHKTQFALIEVFKTFAFTLPLACVILFAIIPLSDQIEQLSNNTFIILGIVLTKAFLDFIVKKGSQYLSNKNDVEKNNI